MNPANDLFHDSTGYEWSWLSTNSCFVFSNSYSFMTPLCGICSPIHSLKLVK